MQKQFIIVLFILGFTLMGWSQDEQEKDDIGTETVTVTKAYTPTISDAFKIKSIPNVNDSIVLQKKKIEYRIFSVPVASTFSPSKGKASQVKKIPPPVLYNSFASAGGGNPANLMAKFYTSRKINRESGYTIGLDHHSSFANIDEIDLNNTYSDTKIEASYTKSERDLRWGADFGFQHLAYNWYGTPQDFFTTAPPSINRNSLDTSQSYFTGELGGHVHIENSFFKSAELKYRRFWDAVESGENRAIFKPNFEFNIADETVAVKFEVDYVGGSFKNASLNKTENIAGISYSNLQIGVNPSFTILRDDLSLNLGLKLVYGLEGEQSRNNFYIYPAITASYRLLDDFAIAYGGIEGNLKQNSYYDFVQENPFVSPTLTIAPTDKKYDAYLGLRGQLLPNLSYNLRGAYKAEDRKALFKLNPLNTSRNDEKNYNLGNSYELFSFDGVSLGDDVKTISFFGEVNVDINRNFTLSANAAYHSYTTETGNHAWNLPNLEASMFLDYQIGKKWYAGANLFFVGERKDFSTIARPNLEQQNFPATIINLDSYIDLNMNLGYRVNDQLSVFVKGANLTSSNYQRWANFRVQGLQVLAGATYKFDL